MNTKLSDADAPDRSLASVWLSEEIIDRFERVAPDLLARRSLLHRTDSKFIVSAPDLKPLLTQIADHYAILTANGEAVMTYQTLYYDTADLQCFHDHRRGRRVRHKVRVRHYPDRGLSYLEVKTKRSDRRTVKYRRAKTYGNNELTSDDRRFIKEHCDVPVAALEPQVWTNFGRLTLVGIDTNERVTIDIDLQFRGRGAADLGAAAIVEVKQSPFCMRTPIMQTLRRRGIRPASASKYCAATALTRTDVRQNRLLPSLRAMQNASL